MKGAPGLIAVVLDNETAEHLRNLAIHSNVFCKHVTMAYRPKPDVYSKYASLMGQEVEFDIVYEAFDSYGQTVAVKGVPSENAVPHITISCADGVPPAYSNKLLDKPEPYKGPVPICRGRGVVEFVRF